MDITHDTQEAMKRNTELLKQIKALKTSEAKVLIENEKLRQENIRLLARISEMQKEVESLKRSQGIYRDLANNPFNR